MTTLIEVVRAARQIQEAARIVDGLPDLSRQVELVATQLKLRSDAQAEIGRAIARPQPAEEVVQRACAQILALQDSMDRTKAISSLALVAFDVSQSIAAMLEHHATVQNLQAIREVATNDWTAAFKASELARRSAWLPLDVHLTRLYELSAIAQASLQRADPETLWNRLALSAAASKQLTTKHNKFASEYGEFFRGISSTVSAIVQVPKSITELPAAEFVNQAALVISTSEVELDAEAEEFEREIGRELAAETSEQLILLIRRLDPRLVVLLEGARAAVAAGHPDHVRHFAVSLRELFTHVLHLLAPDDEVRQWTKEPQHYSNGRPTRRARLLYSTREFAPSFGDFATADVDAVLKFIDAFQKGTHGVSPDLSGQQLIDLGRRMEGLLRLLLVVREASRS